MITCTELDDRDRLKEVASRQPLSIHTNAGTFKHHELLEFIGKLHELLLSEGFDSIYEPTDNLYSQTILLRVGTAYVTVTVSSTTHIFIKWNGVGIPNLESDTVTQVVDTLHQISRLQEVREYCATCHYSGSDGNYCGVGRPMVTGGCGGYIGRTQL